MPKVTVQPYDPDVDAVVLYRSQNGTWTRKSRLTARIDSASTVRVWVGNKPTVSPGGTDPATDGCYFDPSETWSDDLIGGDVWYAVVASDKSATDVYTAIAGSA